jgi:integrase/recombinase XerD
MACATQWDILLHDSAPQMRLYDPYGKRLYLTHAERLAFLDAVRTNTPMLNGLAVVLAFTGCRLSEALALTPNRIEQATGTIVFESLKKRRDGVFRAVPVPTKVFAALSPLLQETPPNRRLFPIHRSTAYRQLVDVMQRAGLNGPQATPKGLRHGFGVSAVQRGAPLNMVQKWLGHTNIKTTAIYANAVGAEEYEMAMKIWATYK